MSGPVRSWVHSGAELLICSRGSSHDTAKYIEMDIVWACASLANILADKMFTVSQYLPRLPVFTRLVSATIMCMTALSLILEISSMTNRNA